MCQLIGKGQARVGAGSATTHAKPIRLRTETILTESPTNVAAKAQAKALAVVALLSAQATSAEIAQARSLFTAVAHESHLRQGTFVRGTLPAANLEVLSQLDSVLWVKPAPRRKLVDEVASRIVGGDAVRNGAVIGSNSWGNDVQGKYDTDAAQFDELARDADPTTPGDQPYILEFSAGNAGPDSQTMDSPASGKNVIATGACENVPNTLRIPMISDTQSEIVGQLSEPSDALQALLRGCPNWVKYTAALGTS